MVSRNQSMLMLLTFVCGCMITALLIQSKTRYPTTPTNIRSTTFLSYDTMDLDDALRKQTSRQSSEDSATEESLNTRFSLIDKHSRLAQSQAPSPLIQPSSQLVNYSVGAFHKDVPPHVVKAITELYQELKANNCIINDLRTTNQPIIPNVYHFVRFNQSFMKFYEMLSVKSALKIGRADLVYIHTNQNPEGRFWDMIKDESRLKVVHRDPPTSIFGKPFGWVQHASDLARIQILREYGGIYMDNDCIVIHEFERIRKHHCVVSKSSHERHMGNMLMMSTKDCVFMRMYEELYKLHYDRDRWYYNGGELPQYAILDQYPGIAFMADEGVQQGMMYWLWKLDNPVIEFQKYWNIIHLFYGHKDYTYNDTMNYDEENIKTRHNSFGRIARWIMYDHEELFE